MQGYILVANSSTYTLDLGGGENVTFTGTGFTYNSLYTPLAGTVTGIAETYGGQVYNVSGFAVKATDLVTWAATDNNAAAFSAILGGANNTISGGAGPDLLRSYGSSDSLSGGAGADTVYGGAGQDILYGGDGGDYIVSGTGFNQVNGNKGEDTIVGHSQVGDWLSGGQGNDVIQLSTSTGHSFVNGNMGADTITGGSAGDTLLGGQGNDVIVGGAGKDFFSGDLGANTLTGGGGNDIFHAGPGHDVVTDWHAGDQVQLSTTVTYTVNQSGADVHIDLSNGGQMVLQNTQVSSLPAGWLVQA